MTDLPFYVNVRVGAKVWNPTGSIGWGEISASMKQPMKVIKYVGNKFQIGDPLWTNGREFTVLQSDCQEVLPPEPTETITHVVDIYSDGRISVDGGTPF